MRATVYQQPMVLCQQWQSVPADDGYTETKSFEIKFCSAKPIIAGLLDLTFLVFVCYSLSVSNKESVFEACGRDLWGYMVARTVLGYSFIFFVICFFGAVGLFVQENSSLPLILFLFLGYHVTLLALGVKFSSDAMGNSACTTALSDASFTNSPLLAQLAYVFVALDSIWVLLSLCMCAMGTALIRTLLQ